MDVGTSPCQPSTENTWGVEERKRTNSTSFLFGDQKRNIKNSRYKKHRFKQVLQNLLTKLPFVIPLDFSHMLPWAFAEGAKAERQI